MSAAAVVAPAEPTRIFRVQNGRLGKDLPAAAVAAVADVDIESYGDWEATVYAAPKEAFSDMDAFAEAAHRRARSADKPRETCKPQMSASEFFAFCHITFKPKAPKDDKKPWEEGYVPPKPKGPPLNGAAILPGYTKKHGLTKCEVLRYTGNDVFLCGMTDTHYIVCLYWTS